MIQALNWIFLGGKLRILSISATAGNSSATLSPGSGKRWIILYGRIELSTSADTGDRYIFVEIDDGSNSLLKLPRNSGAITASQTKSLEIAPYGFCLNTGNQAPSVGHVGLALPLIIEGSMRLKVSISGGFAEDSFTGKFVVLEVPV